MKRSKKRIAEERLPNINKPSGCRKVRKELKEMVDGIKKG